MRPRLPNNVTVKSDFSIDRLLIHDATVQRFIKSRGPGGVYKETWSDLTSIPCRFTGVSPRSTATEPEQQLEFPTQSKVFTRHDADIKEKDRLKFDGKIYEVIDTPYNPSFLNHHLEVLVKQLDTVV